MTRRDFGTVRRLPSGRWQARYQTPAGDRVTAPETFPTRAAGAAYLAKVQTDMDRGDWLDPAAAKQTFAEYATAWLTDRADLRPRTAELYRGLLNRHLIPHLGDVPLSQPVARLDSWQARYRTPADDRVTAPETFQSRADAAAWLALKATALD